MPARPSAVRLPAAAAVVLAALALLLALAVPARAGTERVSDWTHVFEVASYVTAQPPAVPLVLFVADSTGREGTVSEARLTGAVAASGGPLVAAYSLASHNQTFAADLAVVQALPDRPALVLIGVGLSRFTNAQPVPAIPAVGTVTALSPWVQHLYGSRHILSRDQKRALVRTWLRRRAPVFRRNVAANLAALDTLVQTCQAKGMTPVLVELPLNLPIVRHAFDRQRARYRAGCVGIAQARGITYLRFVGRIGLRSRDFYDLIHLVGAGRTKYQTRLAAETATLLAPYAQR